MFTLCHTETISFSAESSKEKSVKANFSQTEDLKNDEKQSQVFHRENAQVQTESLQKSAEIFKDYDVERLSNFLNHIEPFLSKVLRGNTQSKAFDNYELLSDIESTTVACLYSLEKYGENEVNCSSISWNSTQTSIAAAYMNDSHETWCDHDGSVGIWSQRSFSSNKPSTILETDCCVTCVSFHPTIPALLAAGKFNGEIMVWNISGEDDSLLASSEANMNNHREPVTGLIWLPESTSFDAIKLLSFCLDGKILIWGMQKNLLVSIDGFIILSELLPRNFQIKSSRENSEIGILSLSVNSEDSSIFILGTEGGGIFQGSFMSLQPVSYFGMSSVPLKNPLTMCFDRHTDQVTTVQFSPFSRNIFLSSGSGGEIRIYTLLKPKPVIRLSCLNVGINSAVWSPVRPMMLSSITSNGQLQIWDLMANLKQPVESMQMDSKYSAGMCIQHNSNSKDLLATSLSNGTIQIWQLPGSHLKAHNDEIQKLQNISKLANDI